jgi:hypothetical protein
VLALAVAALQRYRGAVGLRHQAEFQVCTAVDRREAGAPLKGGNTHDDLIARVDAREDLPCSLRALRDDLEQLRAVGGRRDALLDALPALLPVRRARSTLKRYSRTDVVATTVRVPGNQAIDGCPVDQLLAWPALLGSAVVFSGLTYGSQMTLSVVWDAGKIVCHETMSRILKHTATEVLGCPVTSFEPGTTKRSTV